MSNLPLLAEFKEPGKQFDLVHAAVSSVALSLQEEQTSWKLKGMGPGRDDGMEGIAWNQMKIKQSLSLAAA